ncbi:hypothetical protein FHG87_005415 [Trinorchestia longiramus]|nr:hypothetical protein FHG87_005415 [Trinorchestia longiramus]
MPVAPSIASYYPTRSSNYYRSGTTPSASLYLGRTSSSDRSSYSSCTPSYGTGNYLLGYTSAYGTSKYSTAKPPRPSYSSSFSSDTYRSRTGRDSSPVRSSYYRNSSESRESEERTFSRGIGARSISDTSSRYASSTISSRLRDSSNTRDSGYSSRLASTSRDRSNDIRNGNSVDTKAYGPSVSSYASNYRWDGRSKNKEKNAENDENEEPEKVRVRERIKSYESFDDDTSTSSSATKNLSDEVVALRKREEDRLSARRQRLGLSPICKSRSHSPDYGTLRTRKSPERNGNEEENDDDEPRQSVLELRRKYDFTNQNGYSSSSKYDDESPTSRPTPTIRCESPSAGSSRRRTDSGNYSRNSSTSNHVQDSGNKSDSDSGRDYRGSRRIESPLPSRKNLSHQSRSPDGRKSPLTNGTSAKQESLQHLDDPACSSSSSSGSGATTSPYTSSSPYSSSVSAYYASRSGGPRTDRVRERVAARLAREMNEGSVEGVQIDDWFS